MKKLITLFFILVLLSGSFFAGIYFGRNYNSNASLNIKDININSTDISQDKKTVTNRRIIIDLHNIDDPRVIGLPSEYKVFFKR